MSDLRDAMRSGDELRKSTIRMARAAIESAEGIRRGELLAALLQEAGVDDATQLAEGSIEAANIKERSALTDAEIEAVIATAIKQRREAADAYDKHNRPEVAARERAEATILESYLPTQMTEEEIESEVRILMAELGATGTGDMKRVMPAAMTRLKGKAEGRAINKVVTKLLSAGSAQ